MKKMKKGNQQPKKKKQKEEKKVDIVGKEDALATDNNMDHTLTEFIRDINIPNFTRNPILCLSSNLCPISKSAKLQKLQISLVSALFAVGSKEHKL